MICSASTNTGMRRSNNQDNFMLRKYTEKTTLCVVCDGMGGAKGGEEASKIAAESFVHTVDQFIIPYLKNRDKQASTSDIKRALAKGVAVANGVGEGVGPLFAEATDGVASASGACASSPEQAERDTAEISMMSKRRMRFKVVPPCYFRVSP